MTTTAISHDAAQILTIDLSEAAITEMTADIRSWIADYINMRWEEGNSSVPLHTYLRLTGKTKKPVIDRVPLSIDLSKAAIEEMPTDFRLWIAILIHRLWALGHGDHIARRTYTLLVPEPTRKTGKSQKKLAKPKHKEMTTTGIK